jgi:hypothetical protein
MGMKMAVFWDVAPCSMVDTNRRFGGVCCLHHQGHRRRWVPTGPHGATSQKTAIFILLLTYCQLIKRMILLIFFLSFILFLPLSLPCTRLSCVWAALSALNCDYRYLQLDIPILSSYSFNKQNLSFVCACGSTLIDYAYFLNIRISGVVLLVA